MENSTALTYSLALENLVRSSVEGFLSGLNANDYKFTSLVYNYTGISADFLSVISHSSSSSQMRGNLAVHANKEFLVKTYPAAGIEVTDHDAGQWACEMTNRIMGIVKSKLACQEIQIEIGIPTIAKGHLELIASPVCPAMTLCFQKNADLWFYVVFSSLMDSSLTFDRVPKEEEVLGEAGDAILF